MFISILDVEASLKPPEVFAPLRIPPRRSRWSPFCFWEASKKYGLIGWIMFLSDVFSESEVPWRHRAVFSLPDKKNWANIFNIQTNIYSHIDILTRQTPTSATGNWTQLQPEFNVIYCPQGSGGPWGGLESVLRRDTVVLWEVLGSLGVLVRVLKALEEDLRVVEEVLARLQVSPWEF